MATRYYIRLPDAKRARGSDASLSFTAVSAEGFAEQLQAALREGSLFERWKAQQDDPDAVDPALGATDPDAVVRGEQDERVEGASGPGVQHGDRGAVTVPDEDRPFDAEPLEHGRQHDVGLVVHVRHRPG